MRERVRAYNTALLEAAAKEPRLITFAYCNPILFGEETMDELERCVALGAPGIKVHPGISGHFPDHKVMMSVYERCQQAGLGVLSDSSSGVRADGNAYGVPNGWRPVLKTFPHLKFIMAHFVGDMWDDRLTLAEEFKDNLWFDIAGGLVDDNHATEGHTMSFSSGSGHLQMSQATRVFRKVGVERVIFGTDAPHRGVGRDILECAKQVMALPMTDEEKEKILAGNAKQFLGLE